MPRKFRDAVLSTAGLLVLFGTLVAVSPLVRERFTQFAGGTNEQWAAPGRTASSLMASAGVTATSYASDNSYQVFFLIVAAVLFFMMLRM